MPSVFVTGASRGLGLEFVRQYQAAGWNVVAACRDPSNAPDLAELDVETITLDLSDGSSIARAAQTLAGRRVDVLLSNAGVMGEGQQFGSLSEAEWERVFYVNSIAPLKLANAMLTPADSIEAMRALIDATKPGQKLKFLDYNGQDLPW